MTQVHCQMDDVNPDSFDPIPPGDYQVRVVDSSVSTSKNGNPMAEFELEVEGPHNTGRKLFDRFVLNHEVGRKRLKGFLVALGHRNPAYLADTEEAHGLVCTAKVAIEKDATGQYDDKNKIKSYKPLGGQAASPGAPPRGAASAPHPSFHPPAGPASQAPATDGGFPPPPSAPGPSPVVTSGMASSAPAQTPPPWAA